MEPDDRRVYQGRSVQHRPSATPHETAEGWSLYQSILCGWPSGRTRFRDLCGDEACRVTIRRAAPRDEALPSCTLPAEPRGFVSSPSSLLVEGSNKDLQEA